MDSCFCSQEVVKVIQEVLLSHFKNENLDFSAHSPKFFATSKMVAKMSLFYLLLGMKFKSTASQGEKQF